MPLLEVSHNIQEVDSTRRRSHVDFYDGTMEEPMPGFESAGEKSSNTVDVTMATAEFAPVSFTPQRSPPRQSSPDSLTDAGSSTPARDSPSPSLPPPRISPPLPNTNPPQSITGSTTATATSAAQNPPVKRKRLTPAERDALEKERAAKKQKIEEEKAIKEAEKQAREQKRQEERAAKESEKQARLAEKAEKEAERQAEKQAKAQEREEKKRKKEEEERKVREEKEKKERSQQKLNAFFAIRAPTTPKKGVPPSNKHLSPQKASVLLASPQKASEASDARSEYEKRFQPFFMKEHVRLATNFFDMDEETKAAKSKILDEYLDGSRGEDVKVLPFNPIDIFHLPNKPTRRGRLHVPVKATMDKFAELSQRPEYSSMDGQTKLRNQVRDDLSKVPVKILSFREDVRPPYRGTVTLKPFQATKSKMEKVARKPSARIFPLNYDYDSEAEWQDEEEGEDLDNMDDEEDDDGEDDMDGFLDDSEDVGVSRRVFTNGMEPESTGLCWENRRRLGPVAKMYNHKLEFILETLKHHSGIDPFSTQYWEPAHQKQPKQSGQSGEAKALMPPPPAPANAFEALTSANTADSIAVKLVPDEDLPAFKRLVLENQKLSKVGLLDFLSKSFEKITKTQVKNTLDRVAEKKGKRGVWELKSDHEL